MSSYSHKRLYPARINRGSNGIGCIHDIFSNPYRRAILYYLQESEGSAPLCDVVRKITSWVKTDNSADVANQTATWLLHTHVLAMEEVDLLDYNPKADTVRLADDVAVTVTPPPDAV